MPISMQHYIQRANIVGGTAQDTGSVFLRQDGNLARTSAFNIFRGHARSGENRATIQDFLRSIRENPVYARHADVAEHMLAERLRTGKPLTGRIIAEVKSRLDQQLAMDLTGTTALGQQLATQGALPPGSGTSFAQYCLTKGRAPQDAHDPALPGLLKDFIRTELLPARLAGQLRARGMGDDATAICKMLDQQGLLGSALDANVAGPVGGLDLATVLGGVDAALAPVLDRLEDIHRDGGDLQSVTQREDSRAILETLTRAVNGHAIDRTEVCSVYALIQMEGRDVSTAEGKSDAVRTFLMNAEGTGVAGPLMHELGLPGNLASPLAHHPTVLKNAREILDRIVPPPAIPTKEQAKAALESALRPFLTQRLPQLKEFVQMSQNPPLELKPKALSPETLPRFINVLLEEEALLNPLLSDDTPMDARFMEQVAHHTHVVESCTHGMTGEFGSDDFMSIQKGAIQLLMARKGIEPGQYQGMMEKTVAKFGAMASQFSSVASLCGRGALRGPGEQGLHLTALGAYRALETHVRVMLDLMPENTLERMGIEGDTMQERVSNLLEGHFQREIPKEELSDATRVFVRSLGVPIDDLSGDVRTRLERAETARVERTEERVQDQALDGVLGEFFPSETEGALAENPVMFYTAFDEAAKTTDLTGIDPDKVKSSMLYKPAYDACRAWMHDHPGPVNVADLRGVIMESIAGSLQQLKTTLDAIDALPLQQGIQVSHGVFTAQEKSVIKDMVLSTGLRDVGLIVRLADLAREKTECIQSMCRDQVVADNMSEAVVELTRSFMPLAQELSLHPVANSEDALGGMLMMATGFSGQSQAQVRNMFESLNGALGQHVAGAFMHVANQGGDAQPRMLGAIRVMEELRMLSGTRLGVKVERDPLYFTQNEAELHAISGQVMENINKLVRNAFSDTDVTLGRHVPPLNAQQLEVLRVIGDRIGVGLGPQGQFLLPRVLQGSARALLAAQEANGAKPLSASQIWRAITGQSAPFLLREQGFGPRLMQHMVSAYDRGLSIACPGMQPAQRETLVFGAFGLGLSFPKMMSLMRPGARLTQDDVCLDLGMSSLRDYGPDNAYGLTTDFRRRGANTVMRFESSQGQVLRTSPFSIPDLENVPTHPHFQIMLDHVRGMSASPAQMARVMQAFSQAALIMPRVLSTTFPGIQFSEHGNFSVTATQREDNTITVDIVSDPALPLRFHQQYVIAPNGDHRCTEFVMERR